MAGKNFIIQGEKLQITLLSLLYLYVDIAATKRSPNINKLNWAIKWNKKGKPWMSTLPVARPKRNM